LRSEFANLVTRDRGGEIVPRPRFETADHHWPPLWTDWLRIPARSNVANSQASTPVSPNLPYAAAAFPKLTVLLDGDVAHRGADKLQWSTLVRQPGRGPMLRLQTLDPHEIAAEVLAAVDAVWS
jgi:hypothetical protein